MKRHLNRFGAVYIFLLLFALTLSMHGIAEYHTAWEENRSHGVNSPEGWKLEFFRAVMENWQSEFLQVAAAAYVIDTMRNLRRWFKAKEEE